MSNSNIDDFLSAFLTSDYFLVFLVIVLIILVVLIIALMKSREEYKDALESKNNVEYLDKATENTIPTKTEEHNDVLEELESLKATSKEELFDENKPLIKQIDIPNIKTYDDVIEDYENSEEENAVISAEELEKRTRERMETLGLSDNQAAIQRYEEDQEKKAIISYEQLLKNASNITLSYKNESASKGAPKINKIEINQKEISAPQNYLEEEEFLKILKEFRVSL
jgi:hypothetical protein